MICDSWECVGSWFGSGGGAAWVQALLTVWVIRWSVKSNREAHERDQEKTRKIFEHERELVREAENYSRASANLRERQGRYNNTMKVRFILSRISIKMKTAERHLSNKDEHLEVLIDGVVKALEREEGFLRQCQMLDLPNTDIMQAVSLSIVNVQGCQEYLLAGKGYLLQIDGTVHSYLAEAEKQCTEITEQCRAIKSEIDQLHAAH